MGITVVLGSQWGDEGESAEFLDNRAERDINMTTGKGKITDMLSQEATLCCRAAGGHSAFHPCYVCTSQRASARAQD